MQPVLKEHKILVLFIEVTIFYLEGTIIYTSDIVMKLINWCYKVLAYSHTAATHVLQLKDSSVSLHISIFTVSSRVQILGIF